MIREVAGGYQVVSESGRNLGGPYKTRAAAERRLKEVEMFKHMAASKQREHDRMNRMIRDGGKAH